MLQGSPQFGGIKVENIDDVSNCDIQTEMIESIARHPNALADKATNQNHVPTKPKTKLLLGNKINKIQARALEKEEEAIAKY